MSTFESFYQEGMETPGETGLAAIEIVDRTEISNFETSDLVTTEQIAEHLRETLPPSHMENCPSIEYRSECNEKYPDAAGTFDRETNEICVWGPAERFGGPEHVLAVVTHEVGHNVHENTMASRPEIAERWAQLHEQSRETFAQEGLGFVSAYASTNVYEDFAETYATYALDPEKLQFFSPEKYEFMKQEIFSDRKQEDYSNLAGMYEADNVLFAA